MPITHENTRKPAPSKHASRFFRSTLVARNRASLKPAPLSVANVARMASPKQDSVMEDGHLQAESQTEDAPGELSAVVDELLDGLTTKFSTVSAEIFAKMDDMSRRLDNLEATVLAGDDSNQSKQG